MRVSVLLSVAIGLMALQGWSATLKGKISVNNTLRAELDKADKKETDSRCYWNEPNGITSVVPPNIDPATDIAVVLTREGAEAPKPDDLATVIVRAADLERKVLVTRPGSTIRFRNEGPFDHELYSIGLDSFRPEKQSSGAFRPIEFAKEGDYEVRCKLMPHFKAYVVVTSATAIVEVARDGTFTVDNLVPGKYVFKIFYSGEWIKHESFEVKDDTKREVSLQIELSAKAKSVEMGGEEKKGEK